MDAEPSEPTLPMQILHLEDSVVDHQLVHRQLARDHFACALTRVDTLADFIVALSSSTFDLVLADYRLGGFTAIDAWRGIQNLENAPPFVLLSGAIGEAAAVSAIQIGISDYLHKSDLPELVRVIERVRKLHSTRIAKERADSELAESERRLSRFAEHLQATVEQERACVAREIHDDIGGALAAINLDLAWLSRHTQDTTAHTHIQSATEMLQHAMGASQRIMMNLRPPLLDQGICAALTWLACNFEKRTGIRTAVRTSDDIGRLSNAIELAAYRTAQEALTNVGKHAECSQVLIEISDANSVFTLEITDDGLGITEDRIANANGFGIRGLKERAKTVGGWLDVSSTVGAGTSIILTVPLITT